jgi:catalase
MEKKKKVLTNEVGSPVIDNTNSLTAGRRGPVMMEDVWLQEKLAHFDREVIPERRMHAKGSGAFGQFTTTHDVTKYTSASLFAEIGKKTEVFVRFSTVAGERGAADAERDIRGFAIKFYTDEGNWDLVGNNTPVFFIRDALQFPDLNHAVKRDPRTNMRSAQNNWDFWTMLPEALHQITVVMSDRGIPASYRHMHGFGSHTYSLINKDGVRSWVKFHLLTEQGIKNLTNEEAAAIVAKDRESHQRDLFDAIERGDFPKWKMYFQIMTEEQALNYKENPFDITKTWSHKDFPIDRGRRDGAQSQSGQLFPGCRAGCFLTFSLGTRYRLVSRQIIARQIVRLWRCSTLSFRCQSRPDSGESSTLSGTQLSSGRHDAS